MFLSFFSTNWVVVFRFIFFCSLLSFLIWNLFPFAKRLENQRCYRIRISTNEDAVRLIVNSYCNHKQIQIVALCEFLVLILRSAENVPIIVDSMWCKQSMCWYSAFFPQMLANGYGNTPWIFGAVYIAHCTTCILIKIKEERLKTESLISIDCNIFSLTVHSSLRWFANGI